MTALDRNYQPPAEGSVRQRSLGEVMTIEEMTRHAMAAAKGSSRFAYVYNYAHDGPGVLRVIRCREPDEHG